MRDRRSEILPELVTLQRPLYILASFLQKLKGGERGQSAFTHLCCPSLNGKAMGLMERLIERQGAEWGYATVGQGARLKAAERRAVSRVQRVPTWLKTGELWLWSIISSQVPNHILRPLDGCNHSKILLNIKLY